MQRCLLMLVQWHDDTATSPIVLATQTLFVHHAHAKEQSSKIYMCFRSLLLFIVQCENCTIYNILVCSRRLINSCRMLLAVIVCVRVCVQWLWMLVRAAALALMPRYTMILTTQHFSPACCV